MHTLFATIALAAGTLVFGSCVVFSQLIGVRWKKNGVYEWSPRLWSRWLLGSTGVKVVVHGTENIEGINAGVFVCNHVSWYDIPVVMQIVPSYGFIAKRELERIPIFGAAARGIGVVYIDRDNRKSAFDSIEDAAAKVRDGACVVVYPEGTRGTTYSLRPFKKGSFVLAIRAGVPIVPVVLHGTIHVNPRGKWLARPGVVNVHILQPVSTDGMTYEHRNVLSNTVHTRMSQVLHETYGVESLADRGDAPEPVVKPGEVPA